MPYILICIELFPYNLNITVSALIFISRGGHLLYNMLTLPLVVPNNRLVARNRISQDRLSLHAARRGPVTDTVKIGCPELRFRLSCCYFSVHCTWLLGRLLWCDESLVASTPYFTGL